ncbi:LysR family transcriptional regulator [Nocardioides perillae]|uniref:DNA-binding transcriptional LysR family regulator n=1 Tax=Nocardioides perillae TaxID=1119534 RepID=A0A7Y9UJK6_9ACTN|nr:DNA-binding transcriptional LysR family regulator [Nocardioides perillae]
MGGEEASVLDVRRLRLLRELALRGTLADVAAALHQSPSAVSQQLAQLEREAGVELLRKAGRRVQLTPEAEILVEHTVAVLERLEQAESDLASAQREVVGPVRLAVFQSAALALLPATLRMLGEDHPRLRVTVTQREPETALLETSARDFDLVVAEQYPGHAAPWHPGLDREPLTGDRIRLALPPTGGGTGSAAAWDAVGSLPDAARSPWVMEPHGAASRHFAEQMCRRAGFEPDVRFETADLQAHVALVASGNAVALLPDLVWVGRGDPGVRLLDLPGDPERSVFTAARRTTTDRPSVRAVRAALARAVVEAGAGPGVGPGGGGAG